MNAAVLAPCLHIWNRSGDVAFILQEFYLRVISTCCGQSLGEWWNREVGAMTWTGQWYFAWTIEDEMCMAHPLRRINIQIRRRAGSKWRQLVESRLALYRTHAIALVSIRRGRGTCPWNLNLAPRAVVARKFRGGDLTCDTNAKNYYKCNSLENYRVTKIDEFHSSQRVCTLALLHWAVNFST